MEKTITGYNLIAVWSHDGKSILLCRRLHEPYLGQLNFVGGHIEPGEDGEDAAYRELFEETAITRDDISLTHILDMRYYLEDCYVEVWAGRLKHPVEVKGEENRLLWSDLDRNFFAPEYAGNGNLGHIIEIVKLEAPEICA